MCGITGIWAFNEVGRFQMTNLEKSTRSLEHRGPDDHGSFNDHFVGLGHRRLSIIDTSAHGHQPMSIQEGRYQIAFNGEIFNYKELRKELISKGVQLHSDSDTEVLLQLYAHEGKDCLQKLNGFFAFAIYDTREKVMFIARDRLGIKPLLYFQDEYKFLFASEIQAVLAYGIDKAIDSHALNYYLQLNYTPAPLTMIKGVKKLLPGHSIEIKNGEVTIEKFYDIPDHQALDKKITYEDAKSQLKEKMTESVRKRMIADVPLGSFLSGGIDSSVITAIAAEQTEQLSTFSIGFKDNKFFDETHYAELVAKKFKTNHTTFSLSNDEMLSHLGDIIDRIDEPFADSSAIPVYILSKKTRDHVTVALSGDGADEIFSGYNKHAAWWKIEHSGMFKNFVSVAAPFASLLPKSRSGALSNYARQIIKFSKASKLSHAERYWFLASLSSQAEATALMNVPPEENQYKARWLSDFSQYQGINDMFRADSKFVLPNDMLKKVDLMSMANSLEVRVPFLDHELVDFVFSLPEEMKINADMRKRILQDTYRDILPPELYQRPKKGFEMPMLDWLKTSLKPELERHVFDRGKIIAQEIFNWEEVTKLKKQLFSMNPKDSHARVWAIYVFQKWYQKYF